MLFKAVYSYTIIKCYIKVLNQMLYQNVKLIKISLVEVQFSKYRRSWVNEVQLCIDTYLKLFIDMPNYDAFKNTEPGAATYETQILCNIT